MTNSAGTLVPADIDVDDQDRLLGYGTSSFTYTANGELASRADGGDTWTFTYDVSGNLEQVILPAPASTDIDYIHDGRNRRVGKRVDGMLVQGFIYGDQLNPVAEVNGAGAVVSRFVYGTKPNVPDYMVRGGNTYRIISDHLGSVVAVVDVATGTVVREVTYDSWGRIVSESGDAGFQPFGFAGGLYDADTGLVRFGARDYDPEMGRWLAKDPIDFAGQSSNLYTYVNGDPVNFVDPSGRILQIFIGPAIATAGAAAPHLAGGGALALISAVLSFPSRDEHRTRNRNNSCPARAEDCGGEPDVLNKVRLDDGSECKYDENGDLQLYSQTTEGGTYNYHNLPWGLWQHIFADWLPHFYYGEGLISIFTHGPGAWEPGARGYEQPDPTNVY